MYEPSGGNLNPIELPKTDLYPSCPVVEDVSMPAGMNLPLLILKAYQTLMLLTK